MKHDASTLSRCCSIRLMDTELVVTETDASRTGGKV
jgi:hypothetical protein